MLDKTKIVSVNIDFETHICILLNGNKLLKIHFFYAYYELYILFNINLLGLGRYRYTIHSWYTAICNYLIIRYTYTYISYNIVEN